MVKGLSPQFPCRTAGCPAMVQMAGHQCAVHKHWTNGPHIHPCVLCRQPIVAGELWQFRGPDRPVHGACVNRKNRPPKPKATQARLW